MLRSTAQERGYRLGIAYGLLAGVCLSSGGLALRLVETASGWQILFYRACAFIVMMMLWLGFTYRAKVWQATRRIGALGLLAAALLGVGAISYVFAVLHTTVANVVVILSASPLLTALLARLLLAERLQAATWWAMLAAFLGIAVMFADGMEVGGLLGIAIAMVAVAVYSVMLVCLRFTRGRDMLPATGLSGIVTMVIAFFMCESLVISTWDLGIGVFLGVFQFGLGFILITLATRHVPAAQVALLSLSEVVLAPAWVWLGVGEHPSMLAFVGGVVVVTAVASQAAISVRLARA